MNEEKENKYSYSYTAPTEAERREIEDIKKQYAPREKSDDSLVKLRALNAKVKRLPTAVGAILGIIGALVMGVGMTMVLEWEIVVWGVLVGIAGIALLVAVYPVHRLLLNRNKRKYGSEIIALSNRLLNN